MKKTYGGVELDIENTNKILFCFSEDSENLNTKYFQLLMKYYYEQVKKCYTEKEYNLIKNLNSIGFGGTDGAKKLEELTLFCSNLIKPTDIYGDRIRKENEKLYDYIGYINSIRNFLYEFKSDDSFKSYFLDDYHTNLLPWSFGDVAQFEQCRVSYFMSFTLDHFASDILDGNDYKQYQNICELFNDVGYMDDVYFGKPELLRELLLNSNIIDIVLELYSQYIYKLLKSNNPLPNYLKKF